MSVEASWAMQQAVFASLTADPGLQILLGDPARIYDAVPAEAVFPYVTIGEIRVRPYPGLPDAAEHDLRLHAWSRYGGRKEVKEIMTAVYGVLQDGALPVSGRRLVSLRYVFADIFQRSDFETFHAVMRYRAVTEPEGGA